MKLKITILGFVLISAALYSAFEVKEINLLKKSGLTYNGLGPLLIRFDGPRNRIVQVNSISSSITLIDDRTGRVINIPVKKRVPQFLKEESMAIDNESGGIYSIADHSLNIVFPKTKTSLNFNTKYQYEMVAVDSKTKNCLLVGKTTDKALFINIKSRKKKFIRLFNEKENISNLNQTPPPPRRKAVYDRNLKKFIIYDGYTKKLISVNSRNFKVVSERKIKVKEGLRLHFAGYDEKNHFLYLVVETSKRKDIEAVRIDCMGKNDKIIVLPGLTEAVGVKLNPEDEQVYIPYDNHHMVHVADFRSGKLIKIPLPSFGNDASAYDRNLKKLFIASWAFGEIYIVDLKKMELEKRVRNVGILPHMFNMAYSPLSKKIYIPTGATAVNGCFGSALTTLNTENFKLDKVYTGWGPAGMLFSKKRDSLLVFNSEDQLAEIFLNGQSDFIRLPVRYPADFKIGLNGNIYFSYGPHQSYWPVVYIWSADNGVCELEIKTMQFFKRRTARLAQKIVVDKAGGIWGTQNSWGKEKIFLSYFPKGIRVFSPQERVYFYKMIERENSPRILKYDNKKNEIFLVKTGEKDSEGGNVIVFNALDKKLVKSVQTGTFPTDLEFDEDKFVVSNYMLNSIDVISRSTDEVSRIKSCKNPLDMTKLGDTYYVIGHGDNTLMRYNSTGKKFFKIPYEGLPDRIISDNRVIYIVSHTSSKMILLSFEPLGKRFKKFFEFKYPYGDPGYGSNNSAFFQRGQFSDSIYRISDIVIIKKGKLVIRDFLSGRIFLLSTSK